MVSNANVVFGLPILVWNCPRRFELPVSTTSDSIYKCDNREQIVYYESLIEIEL